MFHVEHSVEITKIKGNILQASPFREGKYKLLGPRFLCLQLFSRVAGQGYRGRSGVPQKG
jgi:hypothetical protein